jgi:recombination protein RecA
MPRCPARSPGRRHPPPGARATSAPGRPGPRVDILYNEGISKTGDVLDLAVNFGIVKKGGAWFTYGEDRFQGREQFRQKLVESTEFYERLISEVKKKLGMIKDDQASAEPVLEEAAPVKEKKK